jgi:thiosulfate dehydrogenase
MRTLIMLVAATGAALVLVALAIAFLGGIPTNANASPPKLEIRIATAALHASMNRYAPRDGDPIEPTNQNLIDGIKTYTMNCALCHGSLDMKESPLAHSLYPPAPQLILKPLDAPEWRTFYAIRTGVRYTGMPAWSNALGEKDIWEVTAFLSRLDKLPAPVRQYWSDTFGVDPQNGSARQDVQHE